MSKLSECNVVLLDNCDLRPAERLRGAGVGVSGEEVTLSTVRALPFVAGVRAPVLFLRERERVGVPVLDCRLKNMV